MVKLHPYKSIVITINARAKLTRSSQRRIFLESLLSQFERKDMSIGDKNLISAISTDAEYMHFGH